jgi:hypothetical protein
MLGLKKKIRLKKAENENPGENLIDHDQEGD